MSNWPLHIVIPFESSKWHIKEENFDTEYLFVLDTIVEFGILAV